jgi:hypothetical protein
MFDNAKAIPHQDMCTQCNSSGTFTPYILITSNTVRLTESTLDIKSISIFSATSVSDISSSETHTGFQPSFHY